MNRHFLRKVSGLGLLALAPCVTAFAAGSRYSVTANDVYLRSYANSYAVGTLYTGQHFDVQSGNINGYYWGYAHGNYNGCAWIAAGYVSRTGVAGSGAQCPAPPTSGGAGTLISYGYATSNPYPTTDTPKTSHVTCQTATQFGNYRFGSHLDRITTTTYGQYLQWRYASADGRSAMVFNPQNSKWGFVLSSCLRLN